jgi:uncharacterized delta-60 repeat protein
MKKTAVVLLFTLSSLFVKAQDGAIDASFNIGTGAVGASEVCLLPDGKIIIGGGFTSYNGTPIIRIARLNANGSLDTAFNPGVSASDNDISEVVVQSDGKIIAGGAFTTFGGVARGKIARLNADGTLDTSFDPGAGANGNVHAIALQPDGKIIVGGYFTKYNNITRNRIVRLNTDGTLDMTFDIGTGCNGNRVNSIVVQPDGKIIISGLFTQYNGVARSCIARLNADGTLDTTFNPGAGANYEAKSIALQPDNKILIGGYFLSYNNITMNKIARLNTDGTLDTTFNSGITDVNSNINKVTIQPDGKILIGGDFTAYGTAVLKNIARLNADGTLDTGFNSGAGASNSVYSVVIQPDGKIIIGGYFGTYNNISSKGIARINNSVLLGADSFQEIPVTVYPNPSNDIFNVLLDGEVTLNVFDVLGRQILTKRAGMGTNQVDLSQFNQGVYLMKISNDLNQAKVFKLYKR